MKNNLDLIVPVGDKVLVKPLKPQEKTSAGLYLPAGVHKKEEVYSGYVVKTGPGYAIPNIDIDEEWKSNSNNVKYLPLQAEVGDLAIYLQKNAIEVIINNDKYMIVPQSAILLLEKFD